jgi:endonuclease G
LETVIVGAAIPAVLAVSFLLAGVPLAWTNQASVNLASFAPTGDYFVRPCGLVSYNGMARCGRWTLEKIDRHTKHGDRSGLGFRADQDVPDEFNASVASYAGSGKDIGHLIPSADDAGDAQRATFTTSNACPEEPKMNRGVMARCEDHCRTLAQQLGVDYVLIYTAPAWIPAHGSLRCEVIGDSKIWVPTHVYKVAGVFKADGTIELFAWRIPNVDEDQTLDDLQVSVDEAEGDCGLDFFKALPVEQQKKLEAK